MIRSRRSVAVLCIAVVALAPFLPGLSALDFAVVEPSWILLPDLSSTVIVDANPPVAEQPRSLLSLLPSRAPPTPFLA